MRVGAPLAIDLCCGLSGWGEGLAAEGFRVRGYDIEDMFAALNEPKPEQLELVLQDIRTLHGSQFKDADLIVASPPCQKYSYMAMPWKRGKQIARALRGEDVFPPGYTGPQTIAELNAIFDACFRIQCEASEAAGHYIPMVVENVRGAEPWVGKAAWNFGSYYLFGDVPALMPAPIKATKNPGFRFDGSGKSFQTESVNRHVEGVKVRAIAGRSSAPGNGARFTSRDCGVEASEGRKGAGAGAGAEWFDQNLCASSSKSPARKAASAKIAKIPFALSSWIARTYKPK